MKLQFKEQKFQIDAVHAVVDCFKGQALKTNRITLERSKNIIKKAKKAAKGMQPLAFENEVLRNQPQTKNDYFKSRGSDILDKVWKVFGFFPISTQRKAIDNRLV